MRPTLHPTCSARSLSWRGLSLASREADEKHQYGHERMECVAAVLLGAVLCITGLFIGAAGLQKIFAGDQGKLVIPGALAMAAALISIAVKEGMYWYTRNAARKIDSAALMADAWHHRSDALSSVGSFVGVLGARMGFPILDPLAKCSDLHFYRKSVLRHFRRCRAQNDR